jgi:hypothetical protein
VFINLPDGYEHLVGKVKAAFCWAKANGFTHVWKTDDDTYLVPARLLASQLLRFDHIGMWARPAKRVTGDIDCDKGFIHGGASYVVGERALPVLVEAPVNTVSEDRWTTHWIEQAGMKSTNSPRFSYTKRVFGDPAPDFPAPHNDLVAGGELLTLAGGRSELYTAHRQFV